MSGMVCAKTVGHARTLADLQVTLVSVYQASQEIIVKQVCRRFLIILRLLYVIIGNHSVPVKIHVKT